jgi:hypothetical protein
MGQVLACSGALKNKHLFNVVVSSLTEYNRLVGGLSDKQV